MPLFSIFPLAVPSKPVCLPKELLLDTVRTSLGKVPGDVDGRMEPKPRIGMGNDNGNFNCQLECPRLGMAY